MTNSNSSHSHGAEQFKPNTTVAIIVACKGKFLLVEEFENGDRVYNQPAGHLEANENLINAAKRELLEETGLVLEPQYCSGIYYYHRPDLALYYLRFCFAVELDEFVNAQPNDEEIIATHWLSLAEIKSKSEQLRSPLVLQCIDDYLQGNRIPLTLLKTNL